MFSFAIRRSISVLTCAIALPADCCKMMSLVSRATVSDLGLYFGGHSSPWRDRNRRAGSVSPQVVQVTHHPWRDRNKAVAARPTPHCAAGPG